MLAFIRSITKSRFGVIFALIFLGAIGLAFAGADVSNSRLGGGPGGEKVATVGKAAITVADLTKLINSALENARRDNPGLTMAQFVQQGAIEDILTGMADRVAMQQWAASNGMGVSDRLVDSEIVKIPAFQGADGKFSDEAYKSLLRQRGLTDAVVRDDLAKGLIARQLLVPASFGATIPLDATVRYAALLKETRTGSMTFVPSDLFAPRQAPGDQQLAAFYKANTARYMRPEERTIRFAILDEASLKNVAAPTDAEIAQRYRLNTAVYAPSETRSVTQVIVPTEAAAKALAAEVAGGKGIEAAASAKGLSASKLEKQTRSQLAGQTSAAVADAVFATAQGKLIPPAKGQLGWTVARVDAVIQNPGKTLEQARGEIVTAIAAEKRRAALNDVSARIEEAFEKGTGLADAAKSLGLTLQTTAPLLADGSVVGKQGEKAPAEILPLMQTAFSMEREGDPQLAELQAGTRFAVFDVARITAASAPPLAAIRDQVARDWARREGVAGARAAADKLLAQVARKVPLADAVKSLGVTLPEVQPVKLNRGQLAQMGQRIPAPLALLFSMAEGSSKRLAANGDSGWVVVTLTDIEPGAVNPQEPLVANARRELAQVTGREYAEELRAAIRKAVGVTRQTKGLAAVRAQLVPR